jgi:hypothetical protein
MIQDDYADDDADYEYFVRKPRKEECAMDAALGQKEDENDKA